MESPMQELKMKIGDVEVDAELFDAPAADAISAAVPSEAKAQIWGKEAYADYHPNHFSYFALRLRSYTRINELRALL
jgi:hypothetical protein